MNQFEWKAIMAINNASVTMMEALRFEQATETLNDALLLILQQKAVSPPRSSHEEERAYTTGVAQKVETASRRIFNPEQASPVPVSIQVIHHNGAIEGDVDFQQYHVIRIETTEDIGVDEAVSCLLHNYAICWACRAKNTNQLGETIIARYFFQTSFDTLNFLCARSKCPFTIHRFIILMKISGKALVQSHESLGDVQEASAVQATLDAIGAVACALASSSLFSSITSASPAA
jgi:hypothetical protein